MRTMKKVWTYLVIAAVALAAAVNYELFVFPNQFAPSGINGLCTMIQHVWGISVGYLSLLINVPLAIWCYIEVSKPVALRSMVYVLVFSVCPGSNPSTNETESICTRLFDPTENDLKANRSPARISGNEQWQSAKDSVSSNAASSFVKPPRTMNTGIT